MAQAKRFGRCIIIDDDPDILLSARLLLRDLFADVAAFQDPAEALAAMERGAARRRSCSTPISAAARPTPPRASTGSREILQRDPQAVVVMITAHAGIDVAVEAMKRGATDFVSKPWSNERLLATVRTAAALRTSRAEAVTERKRADAVAAPAGDDAAARPLAGDGAGLFADRARRADRRQRPHPRRERHRQGAGRPRAPRPLAPRRPGRWSRSISARSPRTCSRASCSAM